MKSKSIGNLLILGGIILILSAVLLSCYNLWDNRRAEQTSQVVLQNLPSPLPPPPDPQNIPSSDTGIPAQTTEEAEIPPHILNPDMEMPETIVDEIAYIGVLEIPALNLKLPIASKWSLSTAKTAPCRYYGSVYQNNIVLAGHNYQKHFGRLTALPIGTQIQFTDMDGNRFLYETIECETIQATDIEGMCSGNWDMTLFTCTIGGYARSAIRCSKLEHIS